MKCATKITSLKLESKSESEVILVNIKPAFKICIQYKAELHIFPIISQIYMGVYSSLT
jgi:hypothetical protein